MGTDAYRVLRPPPTDPQARLNARIAALEDQVYRLESGVSIPRVKTTGPVTGNGGTIPTTYVGLPNLSVSYTVPNDNLQRRARIDVDARIQSANAAWHAVFMGLAVTGTVVSRMRNNATTGTAASNEDAMDLKYLNSAGSAAMHLQGFEYFVLSPGVAYTFQVQAVSNSATGITWTAVPENWITLTVWPHAAVT